MHRHTTSTPPIIYFVIPCYNEMDCLDETTRQLRRKILTLIKKKQINKKSRIVYIDDGSKDETWKIINSFNKRVIGLKLSRNRGHQNALLAGLLYSRKYCDAAISMDADLQDNIDAIDRFVKKYSEGAEIVYGIRSSRKTDSFLKRNTALLFYKLMNLFGAETVYNHADYRLMSRRALDELSKYSEVNIFLRGIVPLIGLKTDTVSYERAARFAGKSKYSLKKMIDFAVDGITSFSVKPIRLVFWLGLLIFVSSLFVSAYACIVKLLGNAVPGWTFIACSVWLLGGIQTLSVGIIGEYIGKTYSETKSRPKYVIERIKKG